MTKLMTGGLRFVDLVVLTDSDLWAVQVDVVLVALTLNDAVLPGLARRRPRGLPRQIDVSPHPVGLLIAVPIAGAHEGNVRVCVVPECVVLGLSDVVLQVRADGGGEAECVRVLVGVGARVAVLVS